MTYPEMDVESMREKANGTSNHMGGPMGEAEAKSSPAQVRVLRPSTSTFRAFDKACTHTPGKKPAVSLLPRILRASRRSGAWVSIGDLP